ncbi:MAG: S8 family peptidase [Gorillibacterium sp.]|nr:S8 family peptidase [Gorillibacterium sp.]
MPRLCRKGEAPVRDTHFVTCIHDALQVETAGTRHIIRFGSSLDYQDILQLVQQGSIRFPLFSTMRPLPLIRGFSCRLRRPDSLDNLSPRIMVDQDPCFSYGNGSLEPLKEEGKVQLTQVRDGRPTGIRVPLLSPAPTPIASLGQSPRIPWGIREIKAPAVWNRSSGAKVKIAVIDTGIDYNHPDLRQTTVGGINLVDPRRPPLDDNGHGTHIAGTIAASSMLSGLLGVAPEAQIYAVKAFDRYGTAYVSDIVTGVQWSIENNMDIINMSFGMKTPHRALEEALRIAYRLGTVIVASSGNEGKIGDIDYPARYRNVIAVGATGKHNKMAGFSNRGKRIDIYAPGHKVISTWLNGCYQELSGTSMATSHVSGVIALLISAKPEISPLQIKRALIRSATTVTSGRVQLRAGQVNAAQCLKLIAH